MNASVIFNYVTVFQKASQLDGVSALEHNLYTLYRLYQSSFDMRRLLKTGWISIEDKLSIIHSLPCFESSSVFNEMLILILSHKLHAKIPSIYAGVIKQIELQLGRLIVQVSSPVPLTPSIQDTIRQRLSSILNKEIQLKVYLEESLVGGLIIRLPDGTIYDFSYNKVLSDLKYHIMEMN